MNYLIVLLALLYAAPSFAAGTDEEDTVYLPVKAIPGILSPSDLKVDTASYVFRQMAEGLFAIGEGFQVYPKLAETFAWSPDQKTLTVVFKKAKFSDGSGVNVSDVIRSLTSCVKSGNKNLLVSVRNIEGYDDFIRGANKTLSGLRGSESNKVTIHLKKTSPLLLDDLAQADCHIVKPAKDGSFDFLRGAIGTGPYLLKSVTQSEITIARSPYYHDVTDGPATAVYRATKEYRDFQKLKSWATLGVSNTPVESSPEFSQIEFSEMGTQDLIFNNESGPFKNESLRRAVSLAIDYSALSQALSWSKDSLQAGFIPLGMPGFRRRSTENHEIDLDESKKLLHKLGYSVAHPFKFTILISNLPSYEKESELWPKLFDGSAPRFDGEPIWLIFG